MRPNRWTVYAFSNPNRVNIYDNWELIMQIEIIVYYLCLHIFITIC